ncbi:MAG: DHH family phosphoesterase, partial [Xanthomonadales bacterium]|nr:DHH family phosphoesterase [Xanthomonadales bacterium]
MIQIKRREVPETNNLEGLGLSKLIQRLYLSRGITEPSQINYKLQNLLHSSKLSNIKKAAGIVVSCIQKNEKIVIVGDFDADGATATALSIRAIKAFGYDNIEYLVPNRFDFGYGLSSQLIPILQSMQTDLIITVDNGISSISGTAKAKEAGMKVIITDHHLPAEELPDADAIVNPNL